MIDELWFNILGAAIFFLTALNRLFGVSVWRIGFKKRAKIKPIRHRMSESDRLLHKRIDRAIYK